jgi:hypothetical protein
MGFYAAQAALLVSDVPFDLGLAEAEHPAQLLHRGILVERHADLIEREAEVSQRKQTMEASQLTEFVRSVSGGRVDILGLEQSGLVVVTQHPG